MKNMLNTLLASGLPKLTSFGVRVGLSISLFAFARCAFAQINLVPNWSFEDTAYCDTPVEWPILRSPPWFSANYATPDLYSMDMNFPCGTYMDTNDVIGDWCYQAPFHGERFAGEYLWEYGGELKEYMEIRLISPLVVGHSYRVAMEISLPECWQYAVNRVGAYFFTDTVFDPDPGVPGALSVTPQAQFHEPLFYMDETAWMHVEDTIVASGGERFMVIGSFTDNAGTDVQYHPAPFSSAYYYFDAIVVEDITIVESTANQLLVSVVQGTLMVQWPGVEDIDRIELLDLLGNVVVDETGHSIRVLSHLNNAPLASGIYVIRAWCGNRRATAKWARIE